jgi:hypothetical protein
MGFWQGDFGTGAPTGSGVNEPAGVNPCLYYGPVTAAGVSNGGTPQPIFRLGTVAKGTEESEFVFCKLVLATATDLLPGQAYGIDNDYTMTLLTTTADLLGGQVVFAQVFANALAAGTYYIWAQRAGHAAVQAASGTVIGGTGQTGATGGALSFPATGGNATMQVEPARAVIADAGFTFTGDTVSGTPTIKNVSSIKNLTRGTLIAGTGIPATTAIGGIRKVANSWWIDMVLSTTGNLTTARNATATNATVTVTATGTLPAVINRPLQTKVY